MNVIMKNSKEVLLILYLNMIQLVACSDKALVQTSSAKAFWWSTLSPNIVISNNEFYVKPCESITRVIDQNGVKTANIILKVPPRLFTNCQYNRTNQLQYDGQYLTFNMCRTAMGAGGCNTERFRSTDFIHFEEYIGITWLNSEQYEAWRIVGSKSSKADSITKVTQG